MRLRKSLENLRDYTLMTGNTESSLHVSMSSPLKLQVCTPNRKCHLPDATLHLPERVLRRQKDPHETFPKEHILRTWRNPHEILHPIEHLPPNQGWASEGQ